MKRILLSIWLVLIFTSIVNAQNITTTVCPGAGCIDLNVAGQGSIGIQITGTWSGTVTFQASVNNVDYVSLLVIPTTSPTAVTTTTANGVWTAPVAGLTTVRVVFTAWASGTAVVVRRTTTTARKGIDSGVSAPSDATYITQTTSASLSAEQALSTLSTGIMRVATTTGVITSLTDSAGIAANISDETGTGVLVFGTIPTLTTRVVTSGATPAVSNTSANSCGTSAATIIGNDIKGKIIVGATSGTSCTVTFTAAYAVAPSCHANNETTANLARATSTTTTVIIAGIFVAGDSLSYICIG